MARRYDNSVFINCSFDPAYRPLFEALVFATYDCGFYPRSALEVEDSSEVRIDRIIRIIKQCRLAIHDISWTELDPRTRLPHFNMPLELGIFLGAKAFGPSDHRRKACVVLDTSLARYGDFISNIRGQEIRAHRGKPGNAIREVREFLSTHHAPGVILPGGDAMVTRYRQFRRKLPETCNELQLNIDRLSFRDLTSLVVGWLETHPLARASSAR